MRINLRLAFEIARRERLRALEAERDELKALVAEARGAK